MNILHVVQLYYPVASGAAGYFIEIGKRLAGEGHQVTVLTTDAYDLEHFWAPGKRRVDEPESAHDGVRIVRLPVERLPGPPIIYPILRRLMVEISRVPGSAPLLRRLAPLTPRLPGLRSFLLRHAATFDIVHTTNISLDFAVLPLFTFSRRQGIPFVCTPFIHLGEPANRDIRRYYTMRHQLDLLCKSDRVITMTEIESDYLAARGVPRERLRRVGVGITPSTVSGGDGARFRADQNVGGPVVLALGAMAFDKGTIHVVEAMRLLWAQGSDATLVLIGAPLSHFNEFYNRLPQDARDRIRLLAYAPDQAKRDALAAASMLAMPSRTDSFGTVFLEAWCYDLPVIGAKAGGIPGVIDDGRDGLLVPFGDVSALAGAIARLLDDREQARRFGRAGHDKVLRDLTWEQMYDRARAVYAELVDE